MAGTIANGGDEIIAGQQKVRRATFAVLKNGQVWETQSCMVDELALQANPQGVFLTADVVGFNTIYTDTANESIGDLSLSHRMATFQEMEVFVAPVTSVIDLELDKIDVDGFQFRIANNLTLLNTRRTGTRLEEPQRGGACIITGGFALPRLNTVDFLDANNENVRVQIIARFTGPLIPGTSTFNQVSIYFPNCILTGGEAPAAGPEQVGQNYSFMAIAGADRANFPITSLEGPMSVEFVNEDSTHLLLD